MPRDPRHSSEVCSTCPGRCCTARLGLEGVYLLPHEQHARLFAQHLVPGRSWLSFDPRCPFLGGDNRCRIYDRRPMGCRQYFCFEGLTREELVEKFKIYPTHLRMLRKTINE